MRLKFSLRLSVSLSLPVFLITISVPLLHAMAVVRVSSNDIDALVKRSMAILETSEDSQVFIGIAGGPGSGKSTLAETVSQAINEELPHSSIVIPMDGYHISRANLRQVASDGVQIGDVATGKDGTMTTFDDLMSRRGAPWTFDSFSLIQDLQTAKQNGKGTFPIYSREISDPVSNGVELTRDHKIVYCEGNYLLALDDADWQPLATLWDDTWFIDVSEHIIKERLVNRHLERWNDAKIQLWGQGRAGAQAKVEASDLKNLRWIYEKSRGHANVIIESETVCNKNDLLK